MFLVLLFYISHPEGEKKNTVTVKYGAAKCSIFHHLNTHYYINRNMDINGVKCINLPNICEDFFWQLDFFFN